MAKKIIYLIRHGQTDFNRMGAVQGRGVDAGLNETGKKQAEAFYRKYKTVAFQRVFVSNLKRTYQTAQKFIDSGIPCTQLEGLDEISWGVAEGLTIKELGYNIFEELLNNWQNGNLDAALENGESPVQVMERQKEAFGEILKNQNEETILVVTHGRAIRILLAHLLGYPLSEMNRFEHTNTCLYILEYDYDTRKFELILSNNTAHLKEYLN